METAFPPSGLCLAFVGILQRASLLRERIQPKLTVLMKKTLALGIIGMSVLGLAKAAESTASQPDKEAPPTFAGRGDWSDEFAGLSCRITTEKSEYEIGDSVRLLVEVRNTSDSPLSLGIGPLSTIHSGDKKFSTRQSGTLGVTFAEGKQGFFAAYHILFPKGTETETRTVVVQPKTTYSEFLALTPWGPTLASIPSMAQPGKMNLSGGLMQLLKPEGKITQLEFKPVEFAVKAKQERKKAGAKPFVAPESSSPDKSIRLYTDEEAEAFRARLGTLKYPTTPEAACKELGLDIKRLTGRDELMNSSLDGRVGQSYAQVSPNYSISFQFQIYVQGPDGKPMQNDRGEIDKVSIHTRVDVREVRKKDDRVEVSIHDDTLFVDAVSPSGIGDVRLALTSGVWPKKVVVRLKYAADKPFTNLEGPGAALVPMDGKETKGRLNLDARRFDQKSGFETDIPPTELKVLHLQWIDAYR